MSDDEKEGGRPRRATVKMRRRSLRVPVDEVPRRSSPSLPRVSLAGAAAAAPLPPLEPQRTDPGLTMAELSDSDIDFEESREMEVVAPRRPPPAPPTEEVFVSRPVGATSLASVIISPDASTPEPSLSDLGLDPAAVAAAAADDDEDAPADLAPEATMVTDAPSEQATAEHVSPPERVSIPTPPPMKRVSERPPPARLSERPPPPKRLSDRPPPARLSERPPPPMAAPAAVEERVSRLSSPPSNPGAVVVVSRVAMIGTPVRAEPLRVSAELAKAHEADVAREEAAKDEVAKDEGIELDIDEGRTSAPPEVTEDAPDEIAADEIEEEKPPAKPTRPSRPPPPRSVPSMPAVAADPARLAPPLPPGVPSGHPQAQPGGAAALVAPPAPPPPREPSIPHAAPPGPPPAPAPAATAPAAPPPAAPAAAAAAPAAPTVPTDGPPTDPRRAKKKGAWWEDFFNDDYLRTVPSPNPKQVRRQCDFIEQRLGLTAGATVLDVGCGLGLHAVELTRRGFVVVGLDLSLPMLSRAADEAQDQGFKINFLHADMREMSFESAFDAVLSWGTTFGYFEDEANKVVLERMHRALKPGGLLLLDIVNRDYVIRSQPNNVWFEGDGCVVMEETQCNYITSRLHVKRTVMLDDGRQRESAYSVRLYALHELGQMLHQKFRVVEVSGREATPGVYFGADSPRTIVVAERRVEAPPKPPGPPPPKRSDADHTPPPAAPPTSDHG